MGFRWGLGFWVLGFWVQGRLGVSGLGRIVVCTSGSGANGMLLGLAAFIYIWLFIASPDAVMGGGQEEEGLWRFVLVGSDLRGFVIVLSRPKP